MRPRHTALLLLLLPACASVTAEEEWAAVRRGRLERMHADRTPEAAMARVLQQEPGGSRPHLDQQEPLAAGHGRRAFGSKNGPLRAGVRLGVGNVGARVERTQLDDRADARFATVTVDIGAGAGLEANFASSDADLFAGRRINDGVVPRDAATRFGSVGLFPHVHFDPFAGAFRMPVRLGAFTDWQQLDHETARVERDLLTLGPRLVLEPTWTFLDRGDARLSAFARLGGDVGMTWFEESFRGGESRDTSLRWNAEMTAGLRLDVGAFRGELGYGLQQALYADLDGELLGRDRTADVQQQQVFLGFGFTY